MRKRGFTIVAALLCITMASASGGFAKRSPAVGPLRGNGEQWAGTWKTTYGTMTLRLTRDGHLMGTYGPAKHLVTGRIHLDDPRVFSGVWKHAGSDATGRFLFRMTAPGRFEGTWTMGDANPENRGINWRATRK